MPSVSYEVLYHPRNKPRKACDGVLLVDSTSGRVLLKAVVEAGQEDEGPKTNSSPYVYSNIVKSVASQELEDDQLIELGQWTVQIQSSGPPTKAIPQPLAKKPRLVTRKITPPPARSTTKVFRRPLKTVVAQPRASVQSSKRVSHNVPPVKSVSVAPSQPTVLPDVPLPASIRTTLRPHQVDGVEFLWKALNRHKGAMLADEMGLGKTLMTIAILCALHRQDRHKDMLVVCPSSLVGNWANEFDKWIGKASQPKRVVLNQGGVVGVQQIKSYAMKQQQVGQVLIVSYDLFRRNASHFRSVQMLAVDEGHRLKNTDGSQTLTALQSVPTTFRLLITATPIQNNLSEFYNLTQFVCPGILGDLAFFRHTYERPIAAANHKKASPAERARALAQAEALDHITKQFILRRLQKDVLRTTLPPRMEALLFCRPTPEQSDSYRRVAASSRDDPLSALTKLRKICAESDGTSGKVAVLRALLESIRCHSPTDKVVIVSNFTAALSLIQEQIFEHTDWNCSRLDGSLGQQDRQSVVDYFNRSGKAFALLLSSKAGGCGLNLVGANRLVMFDPDWNPALDIQAMGRVYRQGQTKPVFLYRLFTSGTVEEVIYQRQRQKGNLASLAVDGKSDGATRFSREELEECFTLKDVPCDTKTKLGTAWPAFAGAQDLVNCEDAPLRDVSVKLPDALGHVHIVNEDDQVCVALNEPGMKVPLATSHDSSDDEEFEF